MLLRRVDGVLQPRDRKLLMFNAEREALPALERLLQDAGPLIVVP